MGITTCETPKSPPGDYNDERFVLVRRLFLRVKHLNPRQGITTCNFFAKPTAVPP